MEVIDSQLDPQDDRFQANRQHNAALAQELRDRLAQVRRGGGERAQRRHAEQGKLYVRERIRRLLDPGAPFLELSPLAAWEMYFNEAPAAGIVTGIGSVAGERGRATNYVYGAAKAGFAAFLSGLRNRLAKKGVHVLTVLPGFVATRMT